VTAPGSGRDDRHAIGITIGLREIYDKVAELSAAITHLTGVVAALEVTQRNVSSDADGLEARVRQLEQKPVVTPAAMWTAIGVLASVAGVLVAILTR
jgi:hypothetical protein